MDEYDDKCVDFNYTEADLDYKAEYERLKAENRKLKDEIEWYRNSTFEMEKMRAQLDIVYLIFGGRNNG